MLRKCEDWIKKLHWGEPSICVATNWGRGGRSMWTRREMLIIHMGADIDIIYLHQVIIPFVVNSFQSTWIATTNKCGATLIVSYKGGWVLVHRWQFVNCIHVHQCGWRCEAWCKHMAATWNSVRWDLVHQGEKLPTKVFEWFQMFIGLKMWSEKKNTEKIVLTPPSRCSCQTFSVSSMIPHPSLLSQCTPDFPLQTLQPFSVACGIHLNCFLDVVHVQKVKRTSEAGSCDHLMTPFISNNLKACIHLLHHEHGFSVKRICSILNVRKTLAYETLHHHHTHGITFDLNTQQWGVWHRALTSVDLVFIRMLLNQKHTVDTLECN